MLCIMGGNVPANRAHTPKNTKQEGRREIFSARAHCDSELPAAFGRRSTKSLPSLQIRYVAAALPCPSWLGRFFRPLPADLRGA